MSDPRGDDAVRDVVRAWRTLKAPAEASLRAGWPTLALALDRLAASSTAGGAHLSAGELRDIALRYRQSPWATPPRWRDERW